MKHAFPTAFLLLFCCATHGQDWTPNQVDSLRARWQDPALSDSARHNAMQDLIFGGMYSAPSDSGLKWSRELLGFARQRDLKRLEATALNLCGIFFNNQNQWDSAEVSYLQSLSLIHI